MSPSGASARRRDAVLVELLAALIEVDDLEVLGTADHTRVGLELAGEQLEQGALAAAVGADHPEASSRQQDQVEILQQATTAERLLDPGGHQQPLGAAA